LAAENKAERRIRVSYSSVALIVIVIVAVFLAGWGLVAVSNASQIPTSDFVVLPKQPLTTQGAITTVVGVTAIMQKGVAIGVYGYLRTTSGEPVANATLYLTYYLNFNYRTQKTTTDQNGYFQAYFPMNWTGWLPLTVTYFGNAQYQGIQRAFSVNGEGQ